MSNAHQFHHSRLEEEIAKISREDRLQIMMEYEDFKNTGVTGDTCLRREAARINRALEGPDAAFNAIYLVTIGLNVHRYHSIEMLKEAEDLRYALSRDNAMELVRDLAQQLTEREAAVENLLEAGKSVQSPNEMEVEIDNHLESRGAELKDAMANILERFIDQARAITGAPTPTPEDDLKRFQGENDASSPTL